MSKQAFLERVMKAVNAALTEAAMVAAAKAADSFGSDHGGVPSMPGAPPNSQTGHLRNSIAYASPESLGTPLRAAYGTNVPYGKILEFGGLVSAKSTKYLPVPVNHPAKMLLRKLKGASLRTAGVPLKIERAKSGALLLVEKTPRGREKKNGAVFLLKRSVYIRPRPWIRRAAKDARSEMDRAFKHRLRQELGL